MNRAHSYAQVPVQDSNSSSSNSINDDIITSSNNGSGSGSATGGISSKSKGKQNSKGYTTLHNDDEDDDDVAEDSVMLRPMTTASSSAPRRSIYPSRRQHHRLNDHDDDEEDDDFDDREIYDHQGDNEISIAPPLQGSSSASTSSAAGPSSTSFNATGNQGSSSWFSSGSRGMSGARTTNRSFLARLTGRQRPDRDARIMIQTTMDGVFSNLSAKPRVEKPIEEELPPSYKSAALDISPAYYETTVNSSAAGFYMDEDEALVDGLPVGGLLGFMWNMIISMSFQFVGFFLTYLLHTSHATKNGSKAGLGFTFMSMGYQMLQGKSLTEDGTSQDEPSLDADTGYMGNIPPASEIDLPLQSTSEYYWLSWFMVILGAAIVAQSLFEFARAKRTQIVVNASSSEALEESVSASTAAGAAQAFALAMFTAQVANPQPASESASTSGSGSGSTAAPGSTASLSSTTAGAALGAPSGSRTVVVMMP
ncbi:hypothetical protein K457DRAFT_234046 [Linnemannia elongata AG-77]|uniref:Metal homeostatis protein bsd2 n=1 Tax=Linnemannia elongata AG-77 TaxID=1314771 RepID=A0A197JFI2_9FUNG|nr:hypothetical protein K457DRAFT_234046 [Linnemannia elongata AG-77]